MLGAFYINLVDVIYSYDKEKNFMEVHIMERNEMIEELAKKVNVNRKEAEEVLEKCNWDLLDAVIYLERKSNEKDSKILDIKTTKEDNYDEKEGNKKINRVALV